MGSKLNIIGNSSGNNVTELLAFNGYDSYVNFSNVPDVEGPRKIEWKAYWDSSVYLDSSIANAPGTLFLFSLADNSKSECYIDPSQNLLIISLFYKNVAGIQYDYKLSEFPVNPWNNILNFSLDISRNIVNSFMINGENLTLDSSSDASSYDTNVSKIGMGYNNRPYWGNIWDFKQYENETLINHWPGRPNGNTNSAWENEIRYTDVLNFDGSSFVYFAQEPSIIEDKTIFFKLYLNSDTIETTFAAIVSFSHVSDRSDQFMVYTAPSDRIYIVPSNDINDGKYISTSGLGGRVSTWEISKSTGQINYLKINGNNIELNTAISNFMQPDVPGIGRRKLSGTNINAFKDGYIFDVVIKDGNDGTGAILHQWNGRPNGNENNSWIDQVGAIDGSVTGIDGNTPSTTDIPAIDGSIIGNPGIRNIGNYTTSSNLSLNTSIGNYKKLIIG
jgi:hypothetical protein